MGTVNDKLSKLVTTKESIKSAIISKGISVTGGLCFRQDNKFYGGYGTFR